MTEKNALKILDSTFRFLDSILAEDKKKRDRQTDNRRSVSPVQLCREEEESTARQKEMEET
jgi:hypothetical protein